MVASRLVTSNDVAKLYVDHHSWLLGWLRRKLGGSDHAADLAHDTFVRVLGAQARHHDIEIYEPRAYLTTVARRLLINYVQRQVLERAWLDALLMVPEAQMPSPERQLIVLELLQQVDSVLDSLAPKIREAFLLAQFEGMTYEQVGVRLGVTERTVKRYMAVAYEHFIMIMPA